MGVIMSVVFNESARQQRQSPPPAFGWIFGIIGLTLFLLMVGVAILKFRAAQCIKHRRSRTFCMVTAAISCLEFPYGIVLGVFTFLVLGRSSIKDLFEPPQAAET
jgi:tryptophan-rich sensory protein